MKTIVAGVLLMCSALQVFGVREVREITGLQTLLALNPLDVMGPGGTATYVVHDTNFVVTPRLFRLVYTSELATNTTCVFEAAGGVGRWLADDCFSSMAFLGWRGPSDETMRRIVFGTNFALGGDGTLILTNLSIPAVDTNLVINVDSNNVTNPLFVSGPNVLWDRNGSVLQLLLTNISPGLSIEEIMDELSARFSATVPLEIQYDSGAKTLHWVNQLFPGANVIPSTNETGQVTWDIAVPAGTNSWQLAFNTVLSTTPNINTSDEILWSNIGTNWGATLRDNSIAAARLLDNTITAAKISLTLDLGGHSSLEIPNSAAPTTDALGEIAIDSNGWGTGRGAFQIMDGSSNMWAILVPAGTAPSAGAYELTWDTNGFFILTTAAGGSGVTDGNKGDLTISGGGTNYQINAGVVGTTELAATGITPGEYVNPTVTFGADGRATSVVNGDTPEGGGILLDGVPTVWASATFHTDADDIFDATTSGHMSAVVHIQGDSDDRMEVAFTFDETRSNTNYFVRVQTVHPDQPFDNLPVISTYEVGVDGFKILADYNIVGAAQPAGYFWRVWVEDPSSSGIIANVETLAVSNLVVNSLVLSNYTGTLAVSNGIVYVIP